MNRYLIVTHYDNDEVTTSLADNDNEIENEIRHYAKETYKKTIRAIIIVDLRYNNVAISIERYGYFGTIDNLPKTQKFLHSKEFQNYWTKNNTQALYVDFTNIPLIDKKKKGK